MVLIACAGSAQAQYSATVLADGPVSYYRFEEASGTVASDSSGNANDGLHVNGVAVGQPGLSPDLGFALYYDGLNDFTQTANVVGDDFSLEAWFNTSVSSPTGGHTYEGDGLVWADAWGTADDFILGVVNDQVSFFTGNPDTSVAGGQLVNDGQWHHVVATRQRGGDVTLTLDGVEVATGPTSDEILDDNPEIHIGGNTLDDRHFQGFVDEVAYYDRVLAPAEILEHYRVGKQLLFSDGFESGDTSAW
jgi:hypothetical protein